MRPGGVDPPTFGLEERCGGFSRYHCCLLGIASSILLGARCAASAAYSIGLTAATRPVSASVVGGVNEGPHSRGFRKGRQRVPRRRSIAWTSRQRGPMDSATLGVVALSIATGFSFTQVLFRHRRRGVRYAIATLLTVGLVVSITRFVVQPYFQSVPIDRLAESNQLVEAVKRLEPSLRFRLTPGVVAAASPAALRRLSMATMTRHSWKSSDVTIVEVARNLLRNAEALQRQDASACVAYLFPASDGGAVNYTQYLDEIALKADVKALTRALESAANATRSIPETGGRERGMHAVRERLSDRYTTVEFERFQQTPSLIRADRVLACRMGIDMYRETLELPPSQRAEVLRHLMSG